MCRCSVSCSPLSGQPPVKDTIAVLLLDYVSRVTLFFDLCSALRPTACCPKQGLHNGRSFILSSPTTSSAHKHWQRYYRHPLDSLVRRHSSSRPPHLAISLSLSCCILILGIFRSFSPPLSPGFRDYIMDSRLVLFFSFVFSSFAFPSYPSRPSAPLLNMRMISSCVCVCVRDVREWVHVCAVCVQAKIGCGIQRRVCVIIHSHNQKHEQKDKESEWNQTISWVEWKDP